MDERLVRAIQKANATCPEVMNYIAGKAFNVTIRQDYETEVPLSLCEGARLIQRSDSLSASVYYWTLSAACLTVVSGFLSLVTLSTKSFRSVSFIYYRFISAADICYAWFTMPSLISRIQYAGFRSYNLTTYMRFFSDKLENSFADFVELLVAWMAIDRALCHFPVMYNRINQKRVSFCVILVLYLVALAWNVPSIFTETNIFHPERDRYALDKTPFGSGPGGAMYKSALDIWTIIRAVLLASAAMLTSVILIKSGFRKRAMAKSLGGDSITSASLLEQVKRNQFLCFLQLLEAMPLILHSIIKLFILTTHISFDTDTFIKVPLEESQSLINYYWMIVPLILANRTIRIMSHALQFIIYFVFLNTFRVAALKLIRTALRNFGWKGSSVSVMQFR